MNTLLLASLVVVLSAGLAWQNATLLTAVETQQLSLNQLLREATNTPKSNPQPQSDEVSRLKRELAQAQHRLAQAQAHASPAPSCPPPPKPREPTNELKGLCREVLEEAHGMRIVSHYSHQTNVWDLSEEAFRALQAECNEFMLDMLGFHAFATLPALLLFLPQLYLFLFGIDSGFIIVDRLYPHPQPREPFRRHPGLIYAHIYLSAAALFLALAQTSTTAATTSTTFNSRRRHTVLGWLYLACLTLGAAAGVTYAWLQGYGSDGGVGASVAFTGLALAGVVPAWLALWCALVRRDRAAHGLWMSRSVAALWGASVFFRVLANTYLVWVARVSADIYPGWVAMIWMSWVIPVAALELYRTLASPPTAGVVATKTTKAD